MDLSVSTLLKRLQQRKSYFIDVIGVAALLNIKRFPFVVDFKTPPTFIVRDENDREMLSTLF